jgi:hypothetical protein
MLSLGTGKARTYDADIRMRKSGGTDFTVHDVQFDDESFQQPLYYDVRLTRWNSHRSSAGWAVELTHPKVIARTDEVKDISGRRDGAPVASPAPMSSQVPRWRMSFGHNLLTVNHMRRWFPKGERDRTLLGRLWPYAGVGAGIAVPNPLIEFDGEETSGFLVAGPALQALVGVQAEVAGPFSLYAEAKLQWAAIDVPLDGGGSSTADLWTTTFVVGFSVRF